MTLVLILTVGFTFFVGQPHWHELDTLGVEWTLVESLVDRDVWDVDHSNSDYLRSGYQYGGDDGGDGVPNIGTDESKTTVVTSPPFWGEKIKETVK